MPYSKLKKKAGGVVVTNKATGEKRNFGSEKKADEWMRVAEAVKHGWKPTGKKKR